MTRSLVFTCHLVLIQIVTNIYLTQQTSDAVITILRKRVENLLSEIKTLKEDMHKALKILKIYEKTDKMLECLNPWILIEDVICIMELPQVVSRTECEKDCDSFGTSLLWYFNKTEHRSVHKFYRTHLAISSFWYHTSLIRYSKHASSFYDGSPNPFAKYHGLVVYGQGQYGKYYLANMENFDFWSVNKDEDAICICRKF